MHHAAMLLPQTQIQSVDLSTGERYLDGPTPDRLSTYDVFAESQRRTSVATHALVQTAQRLSATRALRRPLEDLFDEMEVLIAVQARERHALVEAAVAVQSIEQELGRE